MFDHALTSWDPILLARIQFGFTVSFHFIFPSFSIGLASYLAVLEGLWLWTGQQRFIDLYRFWLKIFAVAFGMGVVSGITMSYQFGTNWAVFSDRAGPVIGPLMAYEVLTAFFLEAGFLGVMLFGMTRVGKGLHFAATCAVALGTAISAFWILSVNSWMQTPQGYALAANGQFVPVDWWAIVFNPSFPYRLVHTVIAAYLTTALVVGAAAAWRLLKDRDDPANRTAFSMAMWMAALATPLQIAAGDAHGLNTLAHQPAKVMAMEGHFDSHPAGAPLILFGLPDQAAKRVDYAVAVPKLSSLILKHDANAPLAGLDTIPDDREPPVAVVFWSFRIMVGLGLLMLALGLWSLVARLRGKLYDWRWLHRAAVAMGPAGFVAVIAGWITTEVGRQPFTIYNVLRTADSASPIAAPAVASSLVAFVLVYFAVFGLGSWYILRMIAKGVASGEPPPPDSVPQKAAGIHPGPPPAGGRGMSMFADYDLATIWAFVIAFAVFMYVVLDGFDLGIGILFPIFEPGAERDQALNSIAPVWDGNETWLVLGGGGLMAAFPLAFAILMPAFYPLIIAMLLGLVFRGVAFEFRFRDPAHRRFWDFGFTAGSATATLAQGITLGALLQGVEVRGRAYAGGWLDWLSPFSLLTGVGTMAAYALLGACWLIWKTEGGTQDHAHRLARPLGAATLAAIVAVSLATPFLDTDYWSRWFRWPGIALTAPVPVAVAVLAVFFARALAAKREAQPFLLALALFALTFAGLGISLFPWIVPDAVTIWQAAAPAKSQAFTAIGAFVMVPVILAYTAWSYWVFRGKVGDEGYH